MSNIEQLSTKSNIIWNSIGSLFYLGCQWLITVLVVRVSPDFSNAGTLSLAMSVAGTFGTFANYKMGTYQVSDIHHENSLAEYMTFRLQTLAIAFVACAVYSLLTCTLDNIATILLFYLYKSVGLIIDVLHGVDQQNRRMDYIGKSFVLQGIASLVAFLIGMKLFGNLDISIVMMMISVILVLILFDIPHASRFEHVGLGLEIKKSLFFLSTSFPAVCASVAATALLTIPKQELANVLGQEALGIYSSVAAPALIVQMGAQYLYGPLLDVFPKKFFDAPIGEFSSLLKQTVVNILLVSAVAIAGLSVFGDPLLRFVFGEAIGEHTDLLYPVLISTLATAFLWLFSDLLITVRDFKANLIGNLIPLFVVAVSSGWFVRSFGMNGVSYVVAIASLAGVTYLSRRLRINAAQLNKGGL